MRVTPDNAAIFSRHQIDHVLGEASRRETTIHLAKNHGCYLAVPDKSGGGPIFVFARGMNPNEQPFDAWWHRQQSVCGGSDFVEDLGSEVLLDLLTDSPDATAIAVRFLGECGEKMEFLAIG